MKKEPGSLTKRVVLIGVTLLSLLVSGCGNARVTAGSGVPKLPSRDNPFYGIVRRGHDLEMDQLRWQYGEDMRVRKMAAPHNESVSGVVYFGSIRCR